MEINNQNCPELTGRTIGSLHRLDLGDTTLIRELTLNQLRGLKGLGKNAIVQIQALQARLDSEEQATPPGAAPMSDADAKMLAEGGTDLQSIEVVQGGKVTQRIDLGTPPAAEELDYWNEKGLSNQAGAALCALDIKSMSQLVAACRVDGGTTFQVGRLDLTDIPIGKEVTLMLTEWLKACAAHPELDRAGGSEDPDAGRTVWPNHPIHLDAGEDSAVRLTRMIGGQEGPQYEGMSLGERIEAIRLARGYVQRSETPQGTPFSHAVRYQEVIKQYRPLAVMWGVRWQPVMCEELHHERYLEERRDKMPRTWFYTLLRWTIRFFRTEIGPKMDEQAEDLVVITEGLDFQDKGCAKSLTAADKQALLRMFNTEYGDDPDFTPLGDPDLNPEVEAELVAIRELLAKDPQVEDVESQLAAIAGEWGKLHQRRIPNIYAIPIQGLRQISGKLAKDLEQRRHGPQQPAASAERPPSAPPAAATPAPTEGSPAGARPSNVHQHEPQVMQPKTIGQPAQTVKPPTTRGRKKPPDDASDPRFGSAAAESLATGAPESPPAASEPDPPQEPSPEPDEPQGIAAAPGMGMLPGVDPAERDMEALEGSDHLY